MKLRILPAVMIFLAGLTLAADQPPVPLAKPIILAPQLIILDGNTPKSLALSAVQVNTVIEGYTAQTTETLTFRNDFNRVLEGNLDFPLPAGAAVCSFALDVGGQLVEGVPVPKDQARITFEKEERKGVDPGLLEHTAGNSYRMRIYPIPPHGTRTVRVEYVSSIDQDAFSDESKPRAFSYRLPLRWSEAVGDFNLHVEVIGEDAAPQAIGAIAGSAFENHAGKFVLDDALKNIKFDTDMVISLSRPNQHVAIVEKRTHTNPTLADLQAKLDNAQTAGELAEPEYYFAINDVSNPNVPRPTTQPDPPPPAHFGVCWDVGYARAAADKTRDLQALDAILKGNRAVAVDLIVFSNTVQPAQHFDVTGGKTDALLDAIKNLTYDGGTDLSKLSLNHKEDWDYTYLLFSDGLASFGTPLPVEMTRPVYTFSSTARANTALLARIARQSGGQYYDLRNTNDAQLKINSWDAFGLMWIDANPNEVADIYPPLPAATTGLTTITGRLLTDQATITLNYGVHKCVLAKQTYTLRRAGAARTGLVPRLWAQMKLADLETDADANAAAIGDLGRRFNLVTSNTSLLVLETLQQYVQYGIVPPTSRKEIFTQFVEQLKQTKDQKTQAQKQRLDEVEKEWKQRVAWWEKEYKYDPKFVYHEKGQELQQRGMGNGAGGPVPAPAFAPAPALNAPRAAAPMDFAQAQQQAATPVPGSIGGLVAVNGNVAAKKLAGDSSTASGPVITIAPWNPDTPYLKALKDSPPDKAYDVYLQQRHEHGDMPAFYLDCADYFLTHNLRDVGVRILTDIPALGLDSPELLRIAGYRFEQLGEYNLAIDLFEKVRRIRPEERQSYRDLGLALAARGQANNGNVEDYAYALLMLNEVVIRPADQYPEIEVIALEEANRIIKSLELLTLKRSPVIPFDDRFRKLLDTDIRVVMSWDTDNTDIDLWVTEPSGEKCFYGHNRTVIGGMLSDDVTTGYGPEEYQVRKAMPGKYVIQANFFGSRQQALSGPTTVHCTVITNWGRENEKRENLTVRLETAKEVVDVGTVEIK